MDTGNDKIAMLRSFQRSIAGDARISPAHISVYLAIFLLYDRQGTQPVMASKKTIAGAAKISETTYHRCMQQLQEYGYIQYVPSFDPKKMSKIYISPLC